MEFTPPRTFVGKKKEYPTKDDFINGIKKECWCYVNLEDVYDGFIRYYPKGTRDSAYDFGEGVGVYQFVDEKGVGVAEVWTTEKFIESDVRPL